MALKCICLSEEFIGNDSAAVCRRGFAKSKGYQCPRRRERWVVHSTCFDMANLLQTGRAKAFEILNPVGAAISGSGEPDA